MFQLIVGLLGTKSRQINEAARIINDRNTVQYVAPKTLSLCLCLRVE